MAWKQADVDHRLSSAGWRLLKRVKLEAELEFQCYYIGDSGRPMISYPCEQKQVQDAYVEQIKATIEAYFQRFPEQRPPGWTW